ncbi:MAG: ABC transporter ATP-binding protein, partial [Verrucomicrobiota bacterium]
QGRLFEQAGQKFIRDLRNRVFRKLNRQSSGYLHNQRVGDLTSRAISDIQTVQGSLIGGITSLCDELVTFVFVIAIIVKINWMIGVFVVLPLAITFVVMRHYNHRLKGYYQQASRVLGRVSARLNDSLAGHPIIHAFGRVHSEESHFEQETDRHYESSMQAVRLRSVLFPSLFLIGFTTNIIVLGVGVGLVLNGVLSLGGLVAIRIYWWQLNSPMRTLATVSDLLQRAGASSERIYEVLDATDPPMDPVSPQMLKTALQPIRFEDVCFHYREDQAVLQNLNFQIEPRSRVAIAGSSGGGKTTLLNLLLRFYDPIQGRIWCGDTPLDAMTREHWRSFIAPVFQETYLFHASIRENLRYGLADAEDEQLRTALRRAHAWDFVRETPDGLDTVVGERGVKLSGGQRQRLGLARAFLADPQILILDEPTSAVETESEKIILDSIHELMEGRTVILTSHRVSLFAQVERVIFLQDGQVREDGSYAELIRRGGAFAQLNHED